MIERLRGPNLRIPFLFTEYPYLPSLGRKIAEGSFELVHAQSHLFIPSLQAASASARVPFVVTVHGVLNKRGFPTETLQRAYLYTAGARLFRFATRVICLTLSDAYEVERFGCPRSKIRVVPNAVDGELFRPGPSERRNELLWVGRFVPEKGLEQLIAALSFLTARTKLKARLVGGGPQVPRISRLVKEMHLEPYITFHGRVEREEVAELMRTSSLFVFPSLKEGFPIVLLEAMASGLPIVASRIPAVTEILAHGETAYLFRPGDARDLANAIMTVAGDGLLAARLGQNARRVAIERYGWSSVLKRLNRVYEEACDTA